ncbi:MAG: hypothetical protein V4524_02990 [Patescibacteria group bacterium]
MNHTFWATITDVLATKLKPYLPYLQNRMIMFIVVIIGIIVACILIRVAYGFTGNVLSFLIKAANAKRKKMAEEREQARVRNQNFKQYLEVHEKLAPVKAAFDLERVTLADEEARLAIERTVLQEQLGKNAAVAKAKRTRANNSRRFENLFGCRPVMLKKSQNGGHEAYWCDVEVGLSRLAGLIFTEHLRVARRNPTRDDLIPMKIEYEEARLLVKRYSKELYLRTRPWAEQMKLLSPPSARPARERGKQIPYRVPDPPVVKIRRKKRGGDGIIDAEIVK